MTESGFTSQQSLLTTKSCNTLGTDITLTQFSCFERIRRTYFRCRQTFERLVHARASQTGGRRSNCLLVQFEHERHGRGNVAHAFPICLFCLSDLSGFLQFGTGKPLDAESMFPRSPALSAQGENSPKGDTEPGSPKAARPSLDEGKGEESPKKTGENNGELLTFLK